MNKHSLRLSFGFISWCLVQQVFAQVNLPVPNQNTKADACLSVVSRFEETIAYLRSVQGNAAAAEIKEKLLPAKLENEIIFKEGYCGLAKYIKEKKLNR